MITAETILYASTYFGHHYQVAQETHAVANILRFNPCPLMCRVYVFILIKSDVDSRPGQVNFPQICTEVACSASGILDGMWRCLSWSDHYNTIEGTALLIWVEDTIKVEAEVNSSLTAALTSAKYLEIVIAAYNSTFDSDPQLKRLDTFQDMLTNGHGTLHSRVTEAMLEAKRDVDVLAKNDMDQLLYLTGTKMFPLLKVSVSNCIVKHIINCVKIKPFTIPNSFQFTKDDHTAERRADLMQKLENFDKAVSRISNIGREFNADKFADKVLQSLLDAAKVLNPNASSASQVDLPQPAYISTAAAALYDDLDLHSSGSPASGQSAQTQS